MKSQAEAFSYQVIAEILVQHSDIKYYLKLQTADKIAKSLSEGQSTKLFLPTGMDQLVNAFSVLPEAAKTALESSLPPN